MGWIPKEPPFMKSSVKTSISAVTVTAMRSNCLLADMASPHILAVVDGIYQVFVIGEDIHHRVRKGAFILGVEQLHGSLL